MSGSIIQQKQKMKMMINKKKIVSLFHVLLLFPLFVVYADNVQGDVNKDGIVDNKDLLMLERALGAERIDPDWVEECDLNEDGCIDFTDLEILKSNLGSKIQDSAKNDSVSVKDEKKGFPIKTKIIERTPLLQIDSFILENIGESYFAAEVLIDKTGSVVDLKISRGSGDKNVDKYLTIELRKWKFEPVIKDDNPIEIWLYQRINLKELKSDYSLFQSK